MNNKAISAAVTILLIIIVILLIVIGGGAYYIFSGPNYDDIYADRIASGDLVNPVTDLTDEQAIEQFDEDFVYFLLVSIGAYNLHKPPFSSDTPKIEINVDEDFYSAEIDEGEISVSQSELGEDILITTTKAEGVKMLRDESYVSQSFENGYSTIELVASQTTLATKGYLSMYTELTGEEPPAE